MVDVLLVLLAAVCLAICAVRPDAPSTTQAPSEAAASLRATGWKRVIRLTLQAVAGVALVLLVAALRTGMYHLLLAVAGGATWLASAVALERVHIHRLEIRS